MAGLHAPLPTLLRRPRGRLRTDRGRRGLLLLHRSDLSPHTPCQSPGALTRVAACTLAQSPIRDPLPEGFRHFVASMPAPVASGWSGCRVGRAPTGKRRLVTAHTHTCRSRYSSGSAREGGQQTFGIIAFGLPARPLRVMIAGVGRVMTAYTCKLNEFPAAGRRR